MKINNFLSKCKKYLHFESVLKMKQFTTNIKNLIIYNFFGRVEFLFYNLKLETYLTCRLTKSNRDKISDKIVSSTKAGHNKH